MAAAESDSDAAVLLDLVLKQLANVRWGLDCLTTLLLQMLHNLQGHSSLQQLFVATISNCDDAHSSPITHT